MAEVEAMNTLQSLIEEFYSKNPFKSLPKGRLHNAQRVVKTVELEMPRLRKFDKSSMSPGMKQLFEQQMKIVETKLEVEKEFIARHEPKKRKRSLSPPSVNYATVHQPAASSPHVPAQGSQQSAPSFSPFHNSFGTVTQSRPSQTQRPQQSSSSSSSNIDLQRAENGFLFGGALGEAQTRAWQEFHRRTNVEPESNIATRSPSLPGQGFAGANAASFRQDQGQAQAHGQEQPHIRIQSQNQSQGQGQGQSQGPDLQQNPPPIVVTIDHNNRSKKPSVQQVAPGVWLVFSEVKPSIPNVKSQRNFQRFYT